MAPYKSSLKIYNADINIMQFFIVIVMFLTLLSGKVIADDNTSAMNDNIAFYEGENHNYIIRPPDNFKMITDEAFGDGYSFAFIPDSEDYDSASMIIGVNIYQITKKKNFDIEQLIENDTTSLRKHYGKNLSISNVAPLYNQNGDRLKTIYLNDTNQLISNVMMAYYHNDNEVFIFDLNISTSFPRFLAEKIFTACLKHFKIQVKINKK